MSWIDKVKVYFGLSDDFDELYDDQVDHQLDDYDEMPHDDNPTVKKIQRSERFDRKAVVRSINSPQIKMTVIEPRSFNDAQRLADKFKNNIPVIINLQSTESELAKRLIDFSSGLTYGLNGGMQKVADKVFLLTPHTMEVSAEEKQKIQESGFFNQL